MTALHLFFFVLGLTNEFLSSFINSDLASLMVAEQSGKCPYIALCHTPNTSVVKRDRIGNYFPCCRECSCNDTCVEDDSCCPDYFTNEHSTNTDQSIESSKIQVVDTAKEIDRKKCVKVQHGRIHDQKGYMMVATCPLSYEDNVVKTKCEMKLDYHHSYDLLDHVPVTYIHRGGQIYKNRYCGQCNMPTHPYATFWNILLICRMSYFHFNVPLVKDLSEFIEAVQTKIPITCNIGFEQDTTSASLNDTTTTCVYNTMIDTCNNDTANDELQTICKHYTWPIEAYVVNERKIYKNYACMLCNGVNFKESCLNFEDIKSFTVRLTSVFNSTEQLVTYSNKPDQRIINRYFPNADGEVHCKKGFVYDVRKGVCRLVLCPQYFIISSGECVPLFGHLEGVDYCILLQADVTSTEELEVVDITKAFEDILHEHLGEGVMEFSIWRNQNLNVKGVYFVQVYVSGNFSQLRYISALEVLYDFIQRTNIFNNNAKVVFSYNSTMALFNCQPGSVKISKTQNDNFLLVNSYKMNERKRGDLRTPLYIVPAHFCYRISLPESEVKRIGNSYVSVLDRSIHIKNLQIIKDNGNVFIVCLHQGTENTARKVNIFLKDESTNYTFTRIPKQNEKADREPRKPLYTTKVESEGEDLNKSLVAIIATVAFILFIVGLRRTMKRCSKEQIDTYVVEFVNNRTVQITNPQSENGTE